jgi:hypothetical protein
MVDSIIRSDSAGVEIVVSPGVDQALDWTLEREFELGGESEGPESFFSVSAGSVGTDGQGHIYVLDYQGRRVVTFTTDGQFLREFGQEGQGPGELRFPGSLSVSPDGVVSVFDYDKRGLVRYRSDGSVLDHVPLPYSPPRNRQRHIGVLEGGMLVASQIQGGASGQLGHALHMLTGSDTTTLAEWTFPPPAGVTYAGCGGGLRLPRLFEVEIAWSTHSESILVSQSPGYELEVYSGTQLERRFGRALPLREATRDLAILELGEGFEINFGMGPCTIQSAEMVDGRGFAPQVPWVQQVTLSPAGETWVLRKEVGEEMQGPVDVFDSTGAYIGTLPDGSPFPLLFLDASRFAAAETDALDVTRLVVHRVVRE